MDGNPGIVSAEDYDMQHSTYFAASARDTTKSTLSASDVDESLIRRIEAIGLFDFRCMSRSMATFAPSTTSAWWLFCPTGLMEASTFDQPLHALVVIPTRGTPPPLDPKVTRPMRSLSPRFCTINLSASRTRLILTPCIDEEIGTTTTMSIGTCTALGKLNGLVAEVYSV